MSKISKLAICTLEKMLLELSRSLATSIITNTSFTQKVDLSFTLERVAQLLMSANEHIKRIWDPAYKSSFSSLCLMDFIKIMQADRSLIMSNSLGYVSKFCLHYADNYSYNDVLCYDHIILHTIGESIQNISNYDTINNYEIISERLLANITVGTESLFKPIYFNEKMPGRPLSWKWSPQKNFWGNNNYDLVRSTEYLDKFFSYVFADVEISAVEVCAASILFGEDMPVDFIYDMARQIGDEARHAKILEKMLFEVGSNVPTYGTGIVLYRYSQGENLVTRLAIQHLIQEANAVEMNVNLIEEFIKNGQVNFAKNISTINEDEGFHVLIGNKWVKYLLQNRIENPDKLFAIVMSEAAVACGLPIFGKGNWNSIIRVATGFPDSFIGAKELIS